jgi:hypothetical protein
MDKQVATLVCWKWKAPPGVPRTKKQVEYTAGHVNALYRMLSKHISIPFRLICCTDDPEGIDPKVEIVPLWDEFRSLGGCFVRLGCFQKDFSLFGPRFTSIDLDCVITTNIDSLLTRSENLIIWRPGEVSRVSRKSSLYCGSLFTLTAGALPSVYSTFSPDELVKNKMGNYVGGTDQTQITKAVQSPALYTRRDGVYNFLPDSPLLTPRLPVGCKIVFFNGRYSPDDPNLVDPYPWIKEHYPMFGKGEPHYIHDRVIKRFGRRRLIRKVEKKEQEKITFVLFWWGGWPVPDDPRIGVVYIKRLVSGIQRSMPPPWNYSIVLFTDIPGAASLKIPGLDVQELQVPVNLRWNLKKMFMYSPKSKLSGVIISIDLDCVVIGDMSKIAETATLTDSFLTVCRGAYKKEKPGGSVVSFRPSAKHERILWKPVVTKQQAVENMTGGSERIFYTKAIQRKDITFWDHILPGSILSYKRDCKESLPDGAALVRFHGLPRPHEIKTPWVKEYWK